MTVTTIIVIVIFLGCCLLIPILITFFVLLNRRLTVDFQVEGMSFSVDRGLDVSQDQARRLVRTFVDNMAPDPFNRGRLAEHVARIKCHLSAKRLTSSLREGRFTGLTHSSTEIEVACDAKFQDDRGRVELQRTALTYEMLNACIMALVTDGHILALAESFVDPDDETSWWWFKDVTGDDKITADDVRVWKERREPYDRAHRRVRQLAKLIKIPGS